MPDDTDPNLAEIRRRNRAVVLLRLKAEAKKLEARDAKALADEAQENLSDFIKSLDEEHPLFDGGD